MGWCQFAVTDVGFFRSLKRTFQAVFFFSKAWAIYMGAEHGRRLRLCAEGDVIFSNKS